MKPDCRERAVLRRGTRLPTAMVQSLQRFEQVDVHQEEKHLEQRQAFRNAHQLSLTLVRLAVLVLRR